MSVKIPGENKHLSHLLIDHDEKEETFLLAILPFRWDDQKLPRTKPQLLENHELKGQIDAFILIHKRRLSGENLEYFKNNFL